MEPIDLKCLNLTIEESRDIINFIAQKRGSKTGSKNTSRSKKNTSRSKKKHINKQKKT